MEAAMFDNSVFKIEPKANPKAVVQGDFYRFTVLTSRLIRLEYSPDGIFRDEATRLAFNRNFPVPKFTVKETEEKLEIVTEHLHLYYDKKPFSQALSIAVIGMLKHKCTKWHYGMKPIIMALKNPNLGGTCCTLDMIDGACEVEDGLVSRHGFTVIDDSDTQVMDENGWFTPDRGEERLDLYFFGYLENHADALRDFYQLTAPTPMIPRYALGNWWSRYWKYTEKTYLDLMNKFAEKKVPLAVSVIDMDWHITEPPQEFGNGWTGWTWNSDFFPNPERFLKTLHDRNLHTTLNIHPGDGVRGFEKCYPEMAEAMGINPKSKLPVDFDVSNPKFMKAWLEHCLTPLENEGVDFWWIDWQQFDGTEKDGFDPLFMLNHYLYTNNAKNGQKPAILSRYAGLGSHRYPLGFSGDTIMTWDSLEFQPYFTNMATNAGYGWWSHDIGGHKMGEWSDDMQVRWTEYGVFSPVMRLHSGKDMFFLKEPWNFPGNIEEILEDYMRLRHDLIPYMYTAAYENSQGGLPLCAPMYYKYDKMTHSTEFPNQYFFGSEMIVYPITEKMSPKTLTGSVKAWIPKGEWIDFFTGRHYKGEKTMKMYRPLSGIPVLCKAGAIVPMADDGCQNGAPLPKNLKVRTFAGADGRFVMYEDDDRLATKKQAFTEFTLKWGKKASVTKKAVTGTASILPRKRNYEFQMTGIEEPTKVTVLCNNLRKDVSFTYDSITRTASCTVKNVAASEEIVVSFWQTGEIADNDYVAEIERRLPRLQIENEEKAILVSALKHAKDSRGALLAQLPYAAKTPEVLGEFTEIIASAL